MTGLSTPFSGKIEAKAEDHAFLSTAAEAAGDCALVLDVGSGPHCQAASFLASTRRRICCIDVEVSALRSAMNTLGPLADGVLADMSRPNVFRNGVFDLVSGFYSLQHVPEPENCLKSLVALSNGRSIAISVLLDRCQDGCPLPAFLKSCYQSFLQPGDLGHFLQASGCEHISWLRHEIYVEEHEFPCAREYTIGRYSPDQAVKREQRQDFLPRPRKRKRFQWFQPMVSLGQVGFRSLWAWTNFWNPLTWFGWWSPWTCPAEVKHPLTCQNPFWRPADLFKSFWNKAMQV